MAGESVPVVQELSGVWLLDTGHVGRPGTIGVYLLPLGGGAFALVETGPGSTLANVEAAVNEAGFDLAGLEHILVTHVHLDHAGAAGALANRTGARVHVHHRGAPHLIDPSRLLQSAGRVYGDAMDSVWGSMEPVPAEQVNALYDGDLLRIPGLNIEALDTPGHAGHHMAFLLDHVTLLTGDAAGVRMSPAELIRPALPPPETNLELWEDSVAKMRAAVPERLLLTHYGQVLDADEHLALVPERNRQWAQEVLTGLRADEDEEALTERIRTLEEREFREAGLDEVFSARYRVTSDAAMTASGLARYWRKFHPEAIASG